MHFLGIKSSNSSFFGVSHLATHFLICFPLVHCKISPIKYCNISKKIINKTFNFCHLAIFGSFDMKFFLKKNYLKG